MENHGKIEKAQVEDIVKLSPMQEGMLFHYLNNPDSPQYNEQLWVSISGVIEEDCFEKAWAFVAETNEMLRTVFRWDKLEQPVQIVLRSSKVPIEKYYLSKWPEGSLDSDGELQSIRAKIRMRKPDITEAPFEIVLIKTEEQKYEMVILNHHIIYDGWSNSIILNEFITAYKKLLKGEKLHAIHKNKFKEYIKWLEGRDKPRQQAFWQEYLEGYSERLTLTEGHKTKNDNISIINCPLSEDIYENIECFCRDNKITVAAFFYTAWGIVLGRYYNTYDVVFGTTVSGRNANINGIENMVGLFINTIPLRLRDIEKTSFAELSRTVEEQMRHREEFAHTSLVDIKACCPTAKKEELFDSIFIIENYPMDMAMFGQSTGLSVESFVCYENTNYPLSITVEFFKGVNINFIYKDNLFKSGTIRSLSKCLLNIVNQILNNPQELITQIQILDGEERHKLLYEFNDTYAEYPRDKSIHELFEEQAERAPDKVAAVYDDAVLGSSTLSYKVLNERANRLAGVLREKGVKPNCIVPIMIERSPEILIGIMAILKAGGAYLPIDPDYPKERIEYMLEDSGAKLLLTQKLLRDKVGFKGEIIELDNEDAYRGEPYNQKSGSRPDSPAYVIYTSGSTGKPKGVMIEHRNVINFIKAMERKIEFRSTDRILAVTTICFDIFGLETLLPLTIGAEIALANKIQQENAALLDRLIEEKEIDILQLTPSRLQMLIEHGNIGYSFSGVRSLIVGGEPFPRALYDKIKKEVNTDIGIYNVYGPTETTVWSTVAKLEENTDITIGKPISNTRIYILDKQGSLQPIGAAGELYIAGDGVARGYLNRSDLTAEKFVANLFAANEFEHNNLEPGNRMYRTGDLARWLPDGNIEFLGRIDHQVKVRGFRIELGEIESCLLYCDGIKEAVVTAREDSEGSKYLCAYIIGEREFDAAELRAHIAKTLPDYMLPSYFIQLDKMPLTPNGKLDRGALPEPEGGMSAKAEYEAPQNILEEKLARIFGEVLKIERVGTKDNFFELGGHSLKATSLASKIHKELNVEVPLGEIFGKPTIKSLSEYIRGMEDSIYSGIEPVRSQEYYQLSSAQRRLYALHQFEPQGIGYNMPGALLIEGRLEADKLEQAFRALIERHEALRTSFELVGEDIVQRIHREVRFEIEYKEAGDEAEAQEIIKAFVRSFDLGKAPLFRVGLIALPRVGAEEQEKYILIYDMHHIISDGTSMGILVGDAARLYEGKALPELRLQYKDYAAWQNGMKSSEAMKGQEEYWLRSFMGEPPILNLPTDYKRPAMQSFEGDTISFELGRELTKSLRELAKSTGATMYMVLLASLNVLLSKYSGQADIVIGSPIAGRHHEDLENIIGMFVNTLAMRNYPEEEKSFREFVSEVKANTLKAYEAQDYQLEELVEKLDIKRDMSRNPLFDILFVMQNMDMPAPELKGLSIKPYSVNYNMSKFDLSFIAELIGDTIMLRLEYCTKLFKRETVKRLSEHFVKIIEAIGKDSKIRLKDIYMLTEEDEKRLLCDFNDTKLEYPREKTIKQLLEEQAERTPDNTALVMNGEKLTYRELNERANVLAKKLRNELESRYGSARDKKVAIAAQRSIELIIGIAAILKAGAAYVPIDPEYPRDRIEYMLEDSQAELLLIQSEQTEKFGFEGICFDMSDKGIFVGDGSNLSDINEPGDLLYLIYTSGSTGRPKAVMLEHRNIVNLLHFEFARTCIDFGRRVMQFATPSFDVSCQEIFSTLLGGGELYLISNEIRKDVPRLLSFIAENSIETVFLPTAYFKFITGEEQYIRELPDCIRHFVVAGEQLIVAPELRDYLREKRVYLHNHYGPSETHVAAAYTISNEGEIPQIPPIGRPISNTRLYILDKQLRLVPVGVAGELCISGDCVGRGYYNRPELTAEKFVPNPFEPGAIMYRTGDLAKWLPEGDIEFLGRIDHQVKIRGFRVELGEIEGCLLKHGAVKEAAVTAPEDAQGSKYLCAYITAETALTAAELRAHIIKELPEYMLPTYFVQLDKMPLNANGKLDTKALPEPQNQIVAEGNSEAPTNETEEKLAGIWQAVLGVERVGINDSFFELGGHSLKAIKVANMIKQQLQADINLQDIFRCSSIAGLAEHIGRLKAAEYSEIAVAAEQAYYELSYNQRRLLILNQLNPEGTEYNIYGNMKISEKVELEHIKKTFDYLVNRHEALRTSIRKEGGSFVQRIEDKPGFEMGFRDISRLEEAQKAETRENIFEELSTHRFDLGAAPLMISELVKLSENEYELLYCMHHIISDGWSLEILRREFEIAYAAYKNGREPYLEPLNIQYKDFAQWQNKQIENSMQMQEAKEYWKKQLGENISELNMHMKNTKKQVTNKSGASYRIIIDEDIKGKLKEIAAGKRTSLFSVMLSAFYMYFAEITGADDISFGIAGSGRDHAGLENILGFFVNTIVLRNTVDMEENYQDFLGRVSDNVLNALKYQDYPLELILEELKIKYPPINVFINMLNMFEQQGESIGDKRSGPAEDVHNVKFDMEFYLREYSEGIEIVCTYVKEYFAPKAVEYMLNEYASLLTMLSEAADKKVVEYFD